MPGNSHCLECVCARAGVCVCLHVAQCVYRASAWEDKRRSTVHQRHQSRLILVCTYSTCRRNKPVVKSLSSLYSLYESDPEGRSLG